MDRRRSTIQDVAREAGVSTKTVSRVARQDPNVTEKTRTAVRAVIDRLSYRATIAARSTVSARSFQIGLVFDNPKSSYMFALWRGALNVTRSNGYHLIFEPMEDAQRSIGEALSDLIIQSNLESVIVPPPLSDNPEVIEALVKLNRPFARISPSLMPDIGVSVRIDDHAAARAMTEYLISLGHRQIGFIQGKAGTTTSRNRLAGFHTAMKAAGLTVPDWHVEQGDFELRSGVLCGERLLGRPDRPTAIFASNDEMAAGVVMAANRLGLDVPANVSIAGFDDTAIAKNMWPTLTTINQPIRQMAGVAAQCLIDYQRNGQKDKGEIVELNFDLVIRDSTRHL
ncbi:MAG: LacI family DNA-binding transcriptional regulator [Asticcacaulis sp.]